MAECEEMTLAFRVQRWSLLLIRAVLAIVFIYAGVVKAVAPIRFAVDIDNYHLIPWVMAVGLAFYLPWLEITCGLAILFWRWTRGALAILLGLISIFIGAGITARVRGIDITCGCFGGASGNLSFAGHLLIDLVLLGAIVALLMKNYRSGQPGPDTIIPTRSC